MPAPSLTYAAALGLVSTAAALASEPAVLTSPVVTAAVVPAVKPASRPIDLALCLDTSGSMDGLIESAKQKLWAVVNDLALAEPKPVLRVALLTFGNDGHHAENGWVHVQTPFTTDLDLVSEKLFALRTNGGTELVGRVLDKAGDLEWHPSTDALKLIVVAGNESADQDREKPYRDICRARITEGIMINAIYCGPAEDAIAPGWREIALLADGRFASIDKDDGTVVIETPFDIELSRLSTALNTTYIPIGAAGAEGQAKQVAQDDNAWNMNTAAAACRAQTKAQGLYSCAWDLIDAYRAGTVQLEDIKAAELPESMREMTTVERAAHVESMGARRTEIQVEIQEASRQRDAFVRDAMKEQAIDEDQSFDAALRRAIREQAASRGFSFPAEEPAPAAPAAPAPEEKIAVKADGC